jgi:hypothetical protein
MAEAHLSTGRDVIVPQFVGRSGFISELADVAYRTSTTFIEIALWMDRACAIAAFADRRSAPSTQSHLDAATLVDLARLTDPVGRMYDAFVQVVEQRPTTRRVDVVPGHIAQTFAEFMAALDIDAR